MFSKPLGDVGKQKSRYFNQVKGLNNKFAANMAEPRHISSSPSLEELQRAVAAALPVPANPLCSPSPNSDTKSPKEGVCDLHSAKLWFQSDVWKGKEPIEGDAVTAALKEIAQQPQDQLEAKRNSIPRPPSCPPLHIPPSPGKSAVRIHASFGYAGAQDAQASPPSRKTGQPFKLGAPAVKRP